MAPTQGVTQTSLDNLLNVPDNDYYSIDQQRFQINQESLELIPCNLSGCPERVRPCITTMIVRMVMTKTVYTRQSVTSSGHNRSKY